MVSLAATTGVLNGAGRPLQSEINMSNIGDGVKPNRRGALSAGLAFLAAGAATCAGPASAPAAQLGHLSPDEVRLVTAYRENDLQQLAGMLLGVSERKTGETVPDRYRTTTVDPSGVVRDAFGDLLFRGFRSHINR